MAEAGIMVGEMPNKPPPVDYSTCKLYVVWGVLGVERQKTADAFTSSSEKWRNYRLIFDGDFDISREDVQQVAISASLFVSEI